MSIDEGGDKPIERQPLGRHNPYDAMTKYSMRVQRLLLEEGLLDVVTSSEPFFTRLGKMIVALIFFLLTIFATGLAMVWCHERLPNAEQHPPLPDLVLDNLPIIPWAFQATEYLGGVLGLIVLVTFLVHKHRMVLVRRLCVITGCLFLLRCLTMVVTSLSVPGPHLDCAAAQPRTFDEKLGRALEIVSGFGASVNGVQTCGDYMFSGHTLVLTVLNCFAERYTPYHWKGLHILTWTMNLFGCFFILAAHEHYTIDVVIAFFLTKAIFSRYHDSAALQNILTKEERRHASGFPFFVYFEENCRGIIPNEYEPPWQAAKGSTALVEFYMFWDSFMAPNETGTGETAIDNRDISIPEAPPANNAVQRRRHKKTS